eukprot:343935-Rhodomonas_salina.3
MSVELRASEREVEARGAHVVELFLELLRVGLRVPQTLALGVIEEVPHLAGSRTLDQWPAFRMPHASADRAKREQTEHTLIKDATDTIDTRDTATTQQRHSNDTATTQQRHSKDTAKEARHGQRTTPRESRHAPAKRERDRTW